MSNNSDTQYADGSRYPTLRGLLLTSVATVAIVATVAGGASQVELWSQRAHAAPVEVQTAPSVEPSFASLVAAVEPAVISIKVQVDQSVAMNVPGLGQMPPDQFFGFPGQNLPQNRVVTGEGAGFFVSADGYAVTAYHVVDHAQTVQVTANDGSVYDARIVGTDPGTDLAVIKVDDSQVFTYVAFADQPPRVGDWVVAIGNPYGLGSTVTAGIVSALARNIGTSTYDNFIQIDAPINQGNSGGPTFDLQGHVVGINDAIFSPSGGSVGIGFDIPADVAKTVTTALIDNGQVWRGWLGIQVQDVTGDIAASLGLSATTTGALVVSPQAGGPAALAGVEARDVITAVNDSPVHDARGLAQTIAGLSPGTSVKVDILRGGSTMTMDLTLGQMPNAEQTPPA